MEKAEEGIERHLNKLLQRSWDQDKEAKIKQGSYTTSDLLEASYDGSIQEVEKLSLQFHYHKEVVEQLKDRLATLKMAKRDSLERLNR